MKGLYSIAAGEDFIAACARQLIAENQDAPLDLAEYYIFLPTNRACQALRDALVELAPNDSAIMPHIFALGDIDENLLDDDIILQANAFVEGTKPLLPAIHPMHQQLLLVQLVAQFRPDLKEATALIYGLSRELAQFLDRVHNEELELDELVTLVPRENKDSLAIHWQNIMSFLDILREHWPNILAELNLSQLSARRNKLLRDLAQNWQTNKVERHIIIAGSTGTQPATRALIQAVYSLNNGRIILPGLDVECDDREWQEIGKSPSHPQYGLYDLLRALKSNRSNVAPWPAIQRMGSGQAARALLWRHIMAPQAITAHWHTDVAPAEEMFDSVCYLEANSIQNEARMIAMITFDALQKSDQKIAIVTNDNALRDAIQTALMRWNIRADDSSGTGLIHAQPFGLIDLLLGFAQNPSGLNFIVCLRHQLISWQNDTILATLEMQIIRKPILTPTWADIVREVRLCADKNAKKWDALAQLLARFNTFCETINTAATIGAMMHEAIALGEYLCHDKTQDHCHLWDGDNGQDCAKFFKNLLTYYDQHAINSIAQARTVMEQLAIDVRTRPHIAPNTNVVIWGSLEARLQWADIMILAGINEGSWPMLPSHDPWMSPQMWAQFGLADPLRRIGLSAHDFVQAASAPKVILTRARMASGVPTTAGRWWQRLIAIAEIAKADSALSQSAIWQLADQMMLIPSDYTLMERPAPTPDVRPDMIAATSLETYLKNPYSFYCKHILRLRKLNPLSYEDGPRTKGILYHQIIEQFTNSFTSEHLPENAADRLRAIAASVYANLIDPNTHARAMRAWEEVIPKILAWEEKSRAIYTKTLPEIKGTIALSNDFGDIVITGRADRVGIAPDGALQIIDYKTGSPPKKKAVEYGSSPQMGILGLIAARGAFDQPNIRHENANDALMSLQAWHLSSSAKDLTEYLDPDKEDVTQWLDYIYDQLSQIIAHIQDRQSSFPSTSQPPERSSRFAQIDDYAVLARASEWGRFADDETKDE